MDEYGILMFNNYWIFMNLYLCLTKWTQRNYIFAENMIIGL